jgi:hypothetical protein
MVLVGDRTKSLSLLEAGSRSRPTHVPDPRSFPSRRHKPATTLDRPAVRALGAADQAILALDAALLILREEQPLEPPGPRALLHPVVPCIIIPSRPPVKRSVYEPR